MSSPPPREPPGPEPRKSSVGLLIAAVVLLALPAFWVFTLWAASVGATSEGVLPQLILSSVATVLSALLGLLALRRSGSFSGLVIAALALGATVLFALGMRNEYQMAHPTMIETAPKAE